MSFFDLIGNVAAGGLTGLIGTGITQGVDLIKQKQANKHELAKGAQLLLQNEHELKMLDKEKEYQLSMAISENEAAKELAETGLKQATIIADAGNLQASIGHDRASYSLDMSKAGKFGAVLGSIIDLLRGIVRPLTTFFFEIVLAVMVYYSFQEASRIDPSALAGELSKLIDAVIYITTTVVMWWFGARGIKSKK